MTEQAIPSTYAQGIVPGAPFGKYHILDHLGRGGMGDVYKAVQNGLERPVALKVLPHLLARSPEFSDRFNAEALAISRLQHQNIVTLYDYGEIDGQKYIAMQFIQGTTLNRIIQREKPLPYERIIAITKQICRGLKYAHANDIVHRDIKSGNIMIESGDKVYISDFGIAKAIDSPSITTTGMALGTPEFMAPEQCEGGIVDGQSDLYGLGVILFEMVGGKPPFLADSPLAVAYKQVNEQPPLLSKIRNDVPRRLELIVAKCLKKVKAERYRNADELLHDLDSVGEEIAPAPEVSNTLSAPNQRITDRRNADRRHEEGDEPGSSRILSRLPLVLLGAVLVVVAVLQAYQIWSASRLSPAFSSLRIAAIAGPPSTLTQGGQQPPLVLLDGKRATMWGLAAKTQATVVIDFGHPVLWSNLVLETGLSANNTSPALPGPRSLTITSDAAPPIRINLKAVETPQAYTLGLVGQRFDLTFDAQPNSASVIRELHAFGIPYE
jgi:serine/threonine protein kinase